LREGVSRGGRTVLAWLPGAGNAITQIAGLTPQAPGVAMREPAPAHFYSE
jgi:hypothetical protein